jgi:hypothetical protein
LSLHLLGDDKDLAIIATGKTTRENGFGLDGFARSLQFVPVPWHNNAFHKVQCMVAAVLAPGFLVKNFFICVCDVFNRNRFIWWWRRRRRARRITVPSIYWSDTPKKKIDWYGLSGNPNPNAIHLLEKNSDKIDWNILSTNPAAIHLLEENSDKICWFNLSGNTNIFELDRNALHCRMNILREDLVRSALHPKRFAYLVDAETDLEEILDNL